MYQHDAGERIHVFPFLIFSFSFLIHWREPVRVHPAGVKLAFCGCGPAGHGARVPGDDAERNARTAVAHGGGGVFYHGGGAAGVCLRRNGAFQNLRHHHAGV